MVVVSGTFGSLFLAGWVDLWSAVEITALAGLSGLVALLVLQTRRTAAQIRHLRRGLDRQVREVAEIAGENRAELFGRADDLTDRLDTVAESVADLRTEMSGRLSEVQVIKGSTVHSRVVS
ncbi:hypothetical protein KGD82_22575 [Nocardiopsis eucommiae]|uniref:Uncharacterized protein n=1 Tax=Nocardiopsis eucommiae TaxID=2831970 RepID=A0A975LD06_9ACTN|nr:hypothetical protein KGD82_22575 [Nocardiopsis eucommiae]